MMNSVRLIDIGVWIIIALSLGLAVYSTWHGIGLTYDSFDYLSAAQSFNEKGLLLNASGKPYVFHAPLFPIIISVFGEDPIQKIKILNLFLFLFTLLIIQLIFNQYFKHRWLHAMSIFAIGMSVGLQMIYNFVWTEPLFLFFFALHNLFLLRYLKNSNNQDLKGLIVLAFFVGLTRNASLFMIIPTTFIMFLYGKNRRQSPVIYYLLIGSLGFILWNCYVFFIQDGFNLIYRENAFFSGMDINLLNYLDIILQWIFPSFMPFAMRLLLGIALLIISLLTIRKRSSNVQAKVFLIQFFIYTLIMVLIIRVDKDEIERLMAIAYPWFIAGLLLLLDQYWTDIKPGLQRAFQICLVICLVYIGVRSLKNSMMWHKNQSIESQSVETEGDEPNLVA